MRTIILLLCCVHGFCQNTPQNKRQPIDSKIEKVTVFLRGAQVERSGRATIATGKTEIVFTNVSPLIDPQSIQLKADGRITVLSVIHQLNFLKEQEIRDELKSLDTQKGNLLERIAHEKNMLNVYRQEETMLIKNQEIKGEQTVLKTTELREAVDFQRQRLIEVYGKLTEADRAIKRMESEVEKLNRQLHSLNEKKDLSTSEIIVILLAKETSSSSFLLTYLVKKAGWFPTYDIRVQDISKPISLQYKANISQSSGEDWKDIKLYLSTGNPNEGGTKPTVNPWYLRYATYVPLTSMQQSESSYNSPDMVFGKVTDKEGLALANVSVIIKGTTSGTTTQADGSFHIKIPAANSTIQFSAVGMASVETKATNGYLNVKLAEENKSLSEVVVVGYGTSRSNFDREYETFDDKAYRKKKEESAITTSTLYQPTSTVYEIQEAYTVLNDGKIYSADINTYEIKAQYEYYSAPKLDPAAYLTARVTDWQELNLLSGEANLFFEGTFLGKSMLDVMNARDTLNLSLGKDNAIVIKRTLLKEFSQRRFLGSNRTDTRNWEITVRNNKHLPISITIEDNFPISTTKEIEIDNKQASDARINEETQKITWQYNIESKKEIKAVMKYSVKYPKDKHLQLD